MQLRERVRGRRVRAGGSRKVAVGGAFRVRQMAGRGAASPNQRRVAMSLNPLQQQSSQPFGGHISRFLIGFSVVCKL